MKIKYLCALLLAALIYSCDDSTTGIGTDLIPGGDKIPANTDSYEFTTKSLLADSVYARTSTAYLGRYTDEQFGEFTADFIAQFTCMDNFKFEEELTKVIGVNISLQYGSFFGDSLNAMRLQVDTLDKVIPEKDNTNLPDSQHTFFQPPIRNNVIHTPMSLHLSAEQSNMVQTLLYHFQSYTEQVMHPPQSSLYSKNDLRHSDQ